MKTVVIVGSCDTKYREVSYMKSIIERQGLRAVVVDVSTGPDCPKGYDISREEVASAAGVSWASMAPRSKGEKIAFMKDAAADLIQKLYERKELDGILAAGGLQNTVIATAAMRRLPIGIPKVMATTVACGNRKFADVVGDKDIVVIPSICDFTGLNMVTRRILEKACACCAGMVKEAGSILQKEGQKIVVAVTLMGVSNTGACAAIEELERQGIEAVGFHATGVGGVIMEQLAVQGLIDGILDMNLHEITSWYFGGGFSYNKLAETRLQETVSHKVPLVAAPGGLDFVDFGIDELPARMEQRIYMMHNDRTAHIKILPDEAEKIAAIVAGRLKEAKYPIRLLLPTDGMRSNTRQGEELYDPKVDHIILQGIRNLSPYIKTVDVEGNLDSKEWGIRAAREMLKELETCNVKIPYE